MFAIGCAVGFGLAVVVYLIGHAIETAKLPDSCKATPEAWVPPAGRSSMYRPPPPVGGSGTPPLPHGYPSTHAHPVPPLPCPVCNGARTIVDGTVQCYQCRGSGFSY